MFVAANPAVAISVVARLKGFLSNLILSAKSRCAHVFERTR